MLRSLYSEEKLRCETVIAVSAAHWGLSYGFHRYVRQTGIVTKFYATVGGTGRLHRRTPLYEPFDAFCCCSVAFGR